jgi:hypothetical protein
LYTRNSFADIKFLIAEGAQRQPLPTVYQTIPAADISIGRNQASRLLRRNFFVPPGPVVTQQSAILLFTLYYALLQWQKPARDN